MSRNTDDSLTYTKYKTICMLPEEILEAYHDKMTIEKIEELYEKVKLLLSQLSEEEAQENLEQMGQYLQALLDGKKQILPQEMPVENTKKRPRLKEKCVNCQRTTYLQFTDGYYCPNCKRIHVGHLNANGKKLKDMLVKLKLTQTGKISENEKQLLEEVNHTLDKQLLDLNLEMLDELHIIQEMLKLDENSAQLQLRLGLVYHEKRDYGKALDCYKTAWKLDNRDGAILAAMGATYLELGKIYEMNVEFGNADLEDGDYKRAVDCLKKAVEQWKQNEYSSWQPEIMFANYAIALQKTGNTEDAFTFFKMARDAEYHAIDWLVDTYGIGKEIYASKISELMNLAHRVYSENYKIDLNTLKKVRKIFHIPESVKMIGFFDYTTFGSSREGIAVTTDGLYFKTLMPKVMFIKWYELSKYDIEYKNCIQLKLKKGSTGTFEMCFQALLDATKFMEVMNVMQNL